MKQPLTNANLPLQGKFALVTGGSRGIRRGIALKLAERGAAVAINYVKDETAARDTLAKVRAHGTEGFIVRADVSHPEEWSSMAGQVREQFGALDILVSNALGNLLGFMSPPLQVTMAQWDESFQCQSRAFFVGMREMASLLRERGRILHLSGAHPMHYQLPLEGSLL